MAYRPRGNKFFVDVSHQGKRMTATVDTEHEAQLKEMELKTALMTGNTKVETKTTGEWTLGQAVERTKLTRWKGTKSERTAYLNADLVVDHFGHDILLSNISTHDIDDFVDSLKKKGNGDGTINRKLAALSTIMEVAIERGKLSGKPRMRRLKEAKGRIRWLTDREEDVLLETLKLWEKHDHHDAVSVLLDTGMRLGELWRIRKIDISMKQGIIHIWVNKGDEPRSVPMTSRVKEILTRRLEVFGEQPFPYDNAWMRHTWDRAKRHLKLHNDEQFVPHCCRHTCASRLVQRGVSLAVVQAWLGHKNIQVTMRYAHLCPTNLLAAVEALEKRPQ